MKLLANAHLKVKRQRRDFQQKTALHLVQRRDTIYHENVQMANMLMNHRLAKSVSDAGGAAFLSILAMLSYKATCAGREVIAVTPAFTSQTRSGYGVVVQKGVCVRWRACPACGVASHRDHNAALNMLKSS